MDCGRFNEKNEHRTSNVQHPRNAGACAAWNVEWEKMKKQTYDLEERLLEYSVRIIKIVEQLPNTRAGNHVAGPIRNVLNKSNYHHQRWWLVLEEGLGDAEGLGDEGLGDAGNFVNLSIKKLLLS